MDFFNVVNLLGGLALFLYGMTLLGNGLEKMSGGRLERTLEKLTDNVFKGVLLGALVTGAIQSSSATTVILVGLVNAKIIKLRQAVGVIMGANIGTTITAHILRMTDISTDNFFLRLLKPTTLAPALAAAGVALYLISKKSSKKNIGLALVGFGILFMGMFNMEAAVSPLRNVPETADLFALFSNPILGVLVGAAFTAVIQSSSASVGILQALSSTGFLTYSSAFPIIMGQNIGTCITAILASIGGSRNGKRVACVHLSFNIIGTIIFLIATYSYNALVGFPFWNDAIDKGGIANFHTVFNVTATILLIPFAGALERLATKLIKQEPGDIDEDSAALALDEHLLVSPGLAIEHSRETVFMMAKLAKKNFIRAISLFEKYDQKVIEKLKETENTIDRLEDKLSMYLLKISGQEISEADGRAVSELLYISSEYERIGDYSENLYECANALFEHDASFSKEAIAELRVLADAITEIIDLSAKTFKDVDPGYALNIEPLEEVIDSIVESLKSRHIERLRANVCTIDAAFPFMEAISSMERISDHCSNVGVYVIIYHGDMNGLERHDYVRQLHMGQTAHYAERYKHFEGKYLDGIKLKNAPDNN